VNFSVTRLVEGGSLFKSVMNEVQIVLIAGCKNAPQPLFLKRSECIDLVILKKVPYPFSSGGFKLHKLEMPINVTAIHVFTIQGRLAVLDKNMKFSSKCERMK
jgi:hypothetical protein